MTQIQDPATITDQASGPREIAPELPLDVAAILLGSKFETPLDDLRPRH